MNFWTYPMLGAACSLAVCLACTAPAQAGSSSDGWWEGAWSCEADGRPARMEWVAVGDSLDDGPQGGGRWEGVYSDSGLHWVKLTEPRADAQQGLEFRHADGNVWYLAQATESIASGWTTVSDVRSPLTCWR